MPVGSGFKTFNTGDVLTAAQINGYLMTQSVMYFTSTANRDGASGITSPAAGMVCYIDSGDANEGFYTYNGSAWRKGPGWNAAWGYQTTLTSSTTAAYNNASANALGTSATFSFLNGRRYLMCYKWENQNGIATGTVNTYTASVNGGTGTWDDTNIGRETPTSTNMQTVWNATAVYTATSTANGTPRVTGSTSLSPNNQTLTNLVVRIIDIGAGGNPV